MECPELYQYVPSKIFASIGVAIYTILTVLHTVRMVRTRTWDNVFMVAGGVCLTAGFSSRLYSSYYSCSKAAYGIQAVLLILGPTLLMFTVVLSHTAFIAALQPYSSTRRTCFPLRIQRPLYLSINVLLILAQFAGVTITAAFPGDIRLLIPSSKLTIAIYIVQLVFWCFILGENIYSNLLFGRMLKHTAMPLDNKVRYWKWWNQFFGLAIAIIALGRNLVRLTAAGGVTFLVVNEWPSYAFDGYQMAVVMGTWGIWYLPGWIRDTERVPDVRMVVSNLRSGQGEGLVLLKTTLSGGHSGVAINSV